MAISFLLVTIVFSPFQRRRNQSESSAGALESEAVVVLGTAPDAIGAPLRPNGRAGILAIGDEEEDEEEEEDEDDTDLNPALLASSEGGGAGATPESMATPLSVESLPRRELYPSDSTWRLAVEVRQQQQQQQHHTGSLGQLVSSRCLTLISHGKL